MINNARKLFKHPATFSSETEKARYFIHFVSYLCNTKKYLITDNMHVTNGYTYIDHVTDMTANSPVTEM